MNSLLQTWHTLPLAARLSWLLGGVALLLGSLLPHQPALPPTASQLALRPHGVTLLDYNALYLRPVQGISQTSYAQAAARLGEGTLLTTSADGRTCTYQWNGGGRWARLEATFRDGYVVRKYQFALERY